jgi:NAD(P)-dependent dehydrogenase (short-subunit alcohol dehydrogenase family)
LPEEYDEFRTKKEVRERRILMVSINETNGEMRPSLRGKTALVTGGSRGIGRAIALKLASLGADVAICGRDAVKLEETKRALREQGVRTAAVIADVTKAAEITKLVEQVQSTLEPIRLLVNNAGMGLFGPVHEKSEEEWDRLMNTNLKSVFLVSRAVIPGMIGRGGGDIINISSLAGKNVFAGGGIYCASKWGLQGLSGCMAEELRDRGIRVSTVCPGSVATEFSGQGPKDALRVLKPEDVAHAVAMIATQGEQSFLSEVQLRPVRKS